MTLNEAIEIYLTESEKEKASKKAAEAAKAFIKATAGDLDEITTDVWKVYLKRSESFRLDTVALYKDFPDIKETYGKTSVSCSLDIHPVAGAIQKTA